MTEPYNIYAYGRYCVNLATLPINRLSLFPHSVCLSKILQINYTFACCCCPDTGCFSACQASNGVLGQRGQLVTKATRVHKFGANGTRRRPFAYVAHIRSTRRDFAVACPSCEDSRGINDNGSLAPFGSAWMFIL